MTSEKEIFLESVGQRLNSLWRSQQQFLGDSACQGTEGHGKLQERALIPEISMGFKPALNSCHWFPACDCQDLSLCPFVPRGDKLQCLDFSNCWFEGSVKILICWVWSFYYNSELSQKQSMQLVYNPDPQCFSSLAEMSRNPPAQHLHNSSTHELFQYPNFTHQLQPANFQLEMTESSPYWLTSCHSCSSLHMLPTLVKPH